jgi:thioredoxin 1
MLSDPELEKLLQDKMKRFTVQSTAGPIIRLTKSNFDHYVSGDRPVFIDFWAEWCGPCRAMEPVVADLARRYSGEIVFGKLDIDAEPDIATRFDVLSIPTFMIFKSGKPQNAIIGAVGAKVLEKAIEKSLAG